MTDEIINIKQLLIDFREDIVKLMDQKNGALRQNLSNDIDEKIELLRNDLKERHEELDKRLKAKETFPDPPTSAALPKQVNSIGIHSVSKPKYGKGSIFG